MQASRDTAPGWQRIGGRATPCSPAMVLPAVVALAMFQFLPLITAMLDSLQSFSPFDRSSTGWVGFENYIELFADPAFRYALFNTFLYIVLMVVITIPLALALAVLLDRRLPGTTGHAMRSSARSQPLKRWPR